MDAITGRLSAETANLRARLETLTRQSATGFRADTYGGMAPEAPRALSLRGELGRREAYSRALEQAQGRAAVTQTALGRLSEIAQEFGTRVTMALNARDPSSLLTVPERARAALVEVGHLLNSQHAGQYLFSGSDVGREAVPDAALLPHSPLAAAIAGGVASLAPGNAAVVLADIRAFAASPGLAPWSAHLSADLALPAADQEAPRSVPSGDGESIAYGVMASRNSPGVVTVAPPSAGAGWALDLMGNLMALAAMNPAAQAQGADFEQLVAGLRDGFRSAHTALAEEQGILGLTEARMGRAAERHEAVSVALARQLADAQEVDLAETLSELQRVRTTLEASYRAIGSLAGLTLARFLR